MGSNNPRWFRNIDHNGWHSTAGVKMPAAKAKSSAIQQRFHETSHSREDIKAAFLSQELSEDESIRQLVVIGFGQGRAKELLKKWKEEEKERGLLQPSPYLH